MKDDLQFPFDDAVKEAWGSMWETPAQEYRLMVFRLEPQMIKGTKISGFLEAFHLPTTIPDIIEKIGVNYGGGKFQIRIVDGSGKYVKSKMFEISGFPKIPNGILETKHSEVAAVIQPEPAARHHLMRLAAYDISGNSVRYLEGFLERIETTMTTPQIVEYTEQKYGGGKYQLRLLSEGSVYLKSVVFDICGASKGSALVNVPKILDGGSIAIANRPDGAPLGTGPLGMTAGTVQETGGCRCNSTQLLASGCNCGGT